MIALIGASGSGKTALADAFIRIRPEYRRLVTYTTRPIREGETDGVDYHFVSDAAFNALDSRDFFAEVNVYRDWFYGTPKDECGEDKNVIAIVTPAGMRALKAAGYNPITVFLHVDRRTRLISMLERGDNIEEAFRRNQTDVGQFDGVGNEVQIIVNNERHLKKPEELADILSVLVDRLGKEMPEWAKG